MISYRKKQGDFKGVNMKVLGIETSCDETAAALVENGEKILSNVVASSQELHKKTGGIIPEVAAREQIRCVIPVIEEAIGKTPQAASEIDALAVTVGPGLIGSLLVGVETAKTLAFVWQKPIIPINHLLGHIYANWLSTNTPSFPFITLVVSGGHTDLVLIKNHGDVQWVGGTRDDAAGECFDKCARLLGLGYPGGPAIATEAAKLKIKNLKFKIKLPRPMIDESNFDFSFSGLKTAVLREVQNLQNKKQFNKETIVGLSYEIQEAIADVLVAKTLKAAEKFKVKSILLAGGVSANSRLRERFNQQLAISNQQFQFWCPPPKLCTDNAAYIATCAFFNYKPVPWQRITPLPNLSIVGEA